jgi:hypothetical protein
VPTILRLGGHRFFFYSLEGTEPPHVHVERGDDTAKFWLAPVQLAGSSGFRAHELNKLRAVVEERRLSFLEAWHGHFGDPVRSDGG